MLVKCFVVGALLLWRAELPKDAPIVPDSVPLEEEGRFQSSRTYDETLKFYRAFFRRTGGGRLHNIVTLPSIKAMHIQSLQRRTRWEGINVYELHGEARIYVVPRDEEPEEQRFGKTRKPRKRH